MRMRWLLTIVVVCATAVLSAVERGERAAQSHGGIHGDVRDESGSVLPGVTVTVIGERVVPRTAVTDEHGRFRFVALEPGEYDLTAELAGFRTVTQYVTVRRGPLTEVSVTLGVSALQESVTVTGESRRFHERHRGAERPSPSPVIGQSPAFGHPHPYAPSPSVDRRGERYDRVEDNRFHRVLDDPLSTFSIDVDTASYANVRRFLREGQLPPTDAVRIEELVNYFRFDYEPPRNGAPFSVSTDVAVCPWNPKHRLALLGLKGHVFDDRPLPPRNLVFLIDVSGSMASADKLPLVRQALRMLTEELTSRDHVAVVVYAGASGLVLSPTRGDEKERIDRAIAQLEAGGSTNGGEGIQLAYRVAREHFDSDGVNRVILATDGDFNVGITSQEALVDLIERERKSGVFLSVLGVGTGNLNDAAMERLADKGNGNYSYLDSIQEARKVLIAEAGGTLVTIAKDVKIQVEFNPAAVAAYRLVGYENRTLLKEDFNDDRKDAGEIGAGHTVTALYEIVPVGAEMPAAGVDPLKYQRTARATVPTASADELMTVKLRYKAPDGDESRLIAVTVPNRVAPMTSNLGFASAVAEFGMLLRGSPNHGEASLRAAADRARRHRGSDEDGYRAEFIKLVELAEGLKRLARR